MVATIDKAMSGETADTDFGDVGLSNCTPLWGSGSGDKDLRIGTGGRTSILSSLIDCVVAVRLIATLERTW